MFLIVRNYKLTGDTSKWHAFGKAFLVFQAYSNIKSVGISTAGDVHQAMNPTYALQLWFWELGSYNHKADISIVKRLITGYDAAYLGRYFWAYISAPLVAAIPAGLLAKLHLKIMEDGGTRSANELEN